MYQFGPLCFTLLLVLVFSVNVFLEKLIEKTKTSNGAKHRELN